MPVPPLLLALAGLAVWAGCQSEAPPAPAVSAPAAPRPADTVALVSTQTPPARPDSTADSLRADLPDGFVRLRDVAPAVAQEIRYVTPYNFVGEPLDGYGAAECVLTEPAAQALRRVAADLARDGLGLKVYDCYRPQPAVDHFRRWVYTDDERMKPAFYPTEPKSHLFRRGYIARRSGHSRGSTVDLTLVWLPAQNAVLSPRSLPDPAEGPLPRCDGPVGERLDERDLDMGTAYDCLSPLSATENPEVPAEARRNRLRLREAMSRGGFRNYSQEWWHFSLRSEPHPDTYFDFPIE